MNIFYDRKFLKQVKKIPLKQQKRLSELLVFLEENPFDSRLHTKQLSSPLEGLFHFELLGSTVFFFDLSIPKRSLLPA